ncbi:MAG: hypothetical protein JNK10_02270 [Cyclobacteriaceae bacterium]|nr:hypothetical protein [Cyclobacteriaceae bacterium]
MEIPTKSGDKDFDVISMGREGLALIRDTDKYAHGKKKWQIEMVDTVLARQWSTELELENRLQLVGYEHTPGHLYLLFRETETTYYNFQLVNLSIDHQEVQVDKVKFDLTFQLTHFTVAGTSALFGGYINSEPAVLIYNHSSDHPKVLPGLFTKNISLLDLRANQNQSFNVLLTETRQPDDHRLIVRTYDPDGNLLVDDVIKVDQRFTILTGITSTLVQDEMMIMGTYAEGNGKQAAGIFSVVVDPFNEQEVTYTDLASIDHFLDYLPEKKAQKIRDKVSKNKASGKTPNYRANLLPIRLAEHGGSFYLLAEVFHPASSVNAYPYGNPSWNNSYNPYNPFYTPGYPNRSGRYDSPYYPEPSSRSTEVRLIESVVVKFGTKGKAQAGISMKFDDEKRSLMDQTSDFVIARDSIVLTYKKKNEIVYQHEHNDPSVNTEISKTGIVLMRQEDLFKSEEESTGGIRYWYDNHAYLWGYRRVKVVVDEDVESRFVFYANRLDY